MRNVERGLSFHLDAHEQLQVSLGKLKTENILKPLFCYESILRELVVTYLLIRRFLVKAMFLITWRHKPEGKCENARAAVGNEC